jgi:hypothetical protein
MTTQTRECVHNGVAQKTKRLQGQSNLNAWEEPRDTHDQTQTNKTRTNQTPNTQEQKNIKKQAPTTHKTTSNNKTKTPKTPISLLYTPPPLGISPH